MLQQCQLTSHLSSAAIIKPTCLSTLHPFLFATQICGRLLSSTHSGCAGQAGISSCPCSQGCAPAVPPQMGYSQRFPKKGCIHGQAGSLLREEVAWCPCPISLLLSHAMESSSQPCSAGWKM